MQLDSRTAYQSVSFNSQPSKNSIVILLKNGCALEFSVSILNRVKTRLLLNGAITLLEIQKVSILNRVKTRLLSLIKFSIGVNSGLFQFSTE